MPNSIEVISTVSQASNVANSLLYPQHKRDHQAMNLGPTVRRLRKERGYGMNEFADMVDVDRASLSRFERNMQGLSIENLAAIAKALGLRLSELIQEAEEEGDPRKRAMLDLWDKLSPDQRDALFRLLGVQTDQQAK